MALYFVGNDNSKYKYDCCILSTADQNVVSKFVFLNNKDGFDLLLHSLGKPEDIKIGLESTSHYALNLELLLRKESQISNLESEINKFIEEIHPQYMTFPGIGSLSVAVIYTEFGDV